MSNFGYGGERLIYFVDIAGATECILRNNLYFGPVARASNDYRELTPRQLTPITTSSNDSEQVLDYFQKSKDLHDHFRRRHLYMKSLSLDGDSTYPGSTLRPVLGSHVNGAMWQHYADGGRGMALVYDRNELLEALGKSPGSRPIRAAPVNYVNDWKLGSLANQTIEAFMEEGDLSLGHLQGHYENNLLGSLFVKHEDWRYEREFRIVVVGDCGQKVLLDVGNALKKVVLGPHAMCVSDRRELKSTLSALPEHVVIEVVVPQLRETVPMSKLEELIDYSPVCPTDTCSPVEDRKAKAPEAEANFGAEFSESQCPIIGAREQDLVESRDMKALAYLQNEKLSARFALVDSLVEGFFNDVEVFAKELHLQPTQLVGKVFQLGQPMGVRRGLSLDAPSGRARWRFTVLEQRDSGVVRLGYEFKVKASSLVLRLLPRDLRRHFKGWARATGYIEIDEATSEDEIVQFFEELSDETAKMMAGRLRSNSSGSTGSGAGFRKRRGRLLKDLRRLELAGRSRV